MSQRSVFEQVIKYIPRRSFEASVSSHQGNKGVRQLDCWTWFGALLFGQLTGHDSIRAMERVFCHGYQKFRRLGFSPIRRSTLNDKESLKWIVYLLEKQGSRLELLIYKAKLKML